MGAIGLNPIRLDRIGLDPIRINAIKLGVPGASGSDRPYIDPEVLASLKAVCICYGKSNDDPDRAVVKNLVDPDNPFIISNAAFKLNSGFGKYEISLTDSITPARGAKVTDNSIEVVDDTFISSWIYYSKMESAEINSYSIEISGMPEGKLVQYWYNNKEGVASRFDIKEDGIYTLPQSYVPADTGSNKTIGLRVQGSQSQNFVGFKVRIIPSFEGAFVTDGIDDLITSTKTVQEMLGGSNEITVVSLITHISGTGKYNIIGDGGIQVSDYSGQTFMAGTSSSGEKIVELGDKEKLQAVQYTTFDSKLAIGIEDSGYAYYGTFVFNKENVPVDWIHQVIAYFNLDRTLNPDILCNTIKQGITNENHAEFGDKLIDFSGNGRDIQLNNIAWKGNSGIGKYSADFESFDWAVNISQKQHNKATISLNGRLCNHTAIEVDEMKVNIIGNVTELIYWYIANPDDTTRSEIRLTSGINTLPKSYAKDDGQTYNIGFAYISGDSEITIEQIPSHAGALFLDGVNDFGKVTGMPIYKDYTVVADREIIDGLAENADGGVALKGSRYLTGAFCFDYKDAAFSFGTPKMIPLDTKRFISYQSKYVSNGISINIGTATDNDELWIGRLGNDERYSKIAIRFLMSFPYSMSEFLIERQLKKHKLGTLYPDMVEFRPIVKSNLPYSSISYSVNPGEYISVDSMVTITVTLPNTSDKLMEVSCNAISDISISGDNGVYEITGKIVKSPQKINLVISSYLTMLNNETLISNETLIKNE